MQQKVIKHQQLDIVLVIHIIIYIYIYVSHCLALFTVQENSSSELQIIKIQPVKGSAANYIFLKCYIPQFDKIMATK